MYYQSYDTRIRKQTATPIHFKLYGMIKVILIAVNTIMIMFTSNVNIDNHDEDDDEIITSVVTNMLRAKTMVIRVGFLCHRIFFELTVRQ